MPCKLLLLALPLCNHTRASCPCYDIALVRLACAAFRSFLHGSRFKDQQKRRLALGSAADCASLHKYFRKSLATSPMSSQLAVRLRQGVAQHVSEWLQNELAGLSRDVLRTVSAAQTYRSMRMSFPSDTRAFPSTCASALAWGMFPSGSTLAFRPTCASALAWRTAFLPTLAFRSTCASVLASSMSSSCSALVY